MTQRETVRRLLDEHGRTFAGEAGITMRSTPSPLYRLLVLATLLSTRISADIAVAAARELSRSGWRTAERMAGSSWQERVDALGRAHYRRYDERTSEQLGRGAELVLERYRGDLRRLRAEADGRTGRVRSLLTEFPGIGPTGAAIFCREAQAVWPELRPFLDERALRRAGELGLPGEPEQLARLVDGDDVARLAAALLRSARAR